MSLTECVLCYSSLRSVPYVQVKGHFPLTVDAAGAGGPNQDLRRHPRPVL